MAEEPKSGGYINQSVASIVLHVISGTLDVRKFLHIFKEETIEPFPGVRVQVRAGVIGESHFFSVVTPVKSVTEILACTSLPKMRNEHFIFPLSEIELGRTTRELEGINHSFFHQIVLTHNTTFGENKILLQEILDLKKDIESAKNSNHDIGLAYCFPNEGTSGESKSLSPLETSETILHLRVHSIPKRKDPFVKVLVQTVHLYPNERKAVTTSTVLHVRAID